MLGELKYGRFYYLDLKQYHENESKYHLNHYRHLVTSTCNEKLHWLVPLHVLKSTHEAQVLISNC